MNKKLITVILVLVLTLTIGLAACGSDGEINQQITLDKKQITISYIINGAEHSKDTISEGDTPNLPTPTKDKYIFDKWYLDKNLSTEYTDEAFKALTIPEDNTVKIYGRFVLPFEDAVAVYNAGSPIYYSFYATDPNNHTGTAEIFSNETELIANVIADNVAGMQYFDNISGERYTVDVAKKRLIKTNFGDPGTVIPFSGEGIETTIKIDGKNYDSLRFSITGTTSGIYFINEDNKLTKIYAYTMLFDDVIVDTEIPATSVLNGVSSYTRTELITYNPPNNNLSPSLVTGTTYIFEPVEGKTLVIGDVILYDTNDGGSEYPAIIMAINTSAEGTSYTVRAMFETEEITLLASSIKYVLEK